jgi:hypothetical protein
MDAFDNVGETRVSPQISGQNTIRNIPDVLTTFSPSANSLSDKTLAELKAFFDAKGHRPSQAMWTALTELASVLEDMAEGRCEPKMFLSSLDPGVGKTQTVTHFIRALTSSKEHLYRGPDLCVPPKGDPTLRRRDGFIAD